MGIDTFNQFLVQIEEYERLETILELLARTKDVPQHVKKLTKLNKDIKKQPSELFDAEVLSKGLVSYLKIMKVVDEAFADSICSKKGQSFKRFMKLDTAPLAAELTRALFGSKQNFTDEELLLMKDVNTNIGHMQRVQSKSCTASVDVTGLNDDEDIPVIAIDSDLICEMKWARAKSQIVKKKDFIRNPDIDRALVLLQKEFYYAAKMFLNSGIYPLFVWDGKAPEEKGAKYARYKKNDARIEARRLKCDKQIAKCHELGIAVSDHIKEEKRKIFMQTTRIPPGGKRKIKDLLSSMGLPVVQSNTEADPYCVFLERIGVADGVYTTDSDVLVHGAKHRFKNIESSFVEEDIARDVKPHMTIKLTGTSHERILAASKLSSKQFVDLCILSQCDYNDKIKGYGMMTAYKDMRLFGSLERILEEKHSDKDSSCLNVEACRRLFSAVDYPLNPEELQVSPEAIDSGGSKYLNELEIGEDTSYLSLKISNLVDRGKAIRVPERFV